MSWHPLVYSSNLAASANLQALAAIRDGVLTLDGAIYFLVPQGSGSGGGAPALSNILRAYALGTTIGRAQIYSPSLSQRYLPELAPVDRGGPAAGTWFKLVRYDDNPIPIVPSEDLGINVRQDAAGAEQETVVLIIADGPFKPVTGAKVNSVRATAAITATALGWTTGIPLVLDQPLKAGGYDLIGARCKSATGVVFRFLFLGQYYRPGGLMVRNYNDIDPRDQRNGGLGTWGSFTNTTVPTLDVFCSGADTTVELVLDLVGPK